MLLTIGVASFPNGHPLFLFVELGVPTRSIMTELVNQYEAVVIVSYADINKLGALQSYPGRTTS